MRYKFNLHYHKGPAELVFSKYAADGSTAIQLYDPRDKEPIACATVCLVAYNIKPEAGEVIIKSWSENEGMAGEMQRLGIIGPAKRTVPAGYCEATVHDLLVQP
jgi:hypothetical protein